MIELLLKLLDKSVEFLREGEKKKKLFFDEVVTPIQNEFQKLYDGHVATFKQARSMLLDSQIKPSAIKNFSD